MFQEAVKRIFKQKSPLCEIYNKSYEVIISMLGHKVIFCTFSASVSNPGFSEPEIRFFGYFLPPETRVFQLPNPGIFWKMELLLH